MSIYTLVSDIFVSPMLKIFFHLCLSSAGQAFHHGPWFPSVFSPWAPSLSTQSKWHGVPLKIYPPRWFSLAIIFQDQPLSKASTHLLSIFVFTHILSHPLCKGSLVFFLLFLSTHTRWLVNQCVSWGRGTGATVVETGDLGSLLRQLPSSLWSLRHGGLTRLSGW